MFSAKIKHKHIWKIVLGLVCFPKGDGGYYEYQAKCNECGECSQLNDELIEHIFKNGGINEA